MNKSLLLIAFAAVLVDGTFASREFENQPQHQQQSSHASAPAFSTTAHSSFISPALANSFPPGLSPTPDHFAPSAPTLEVMHQVEASKAASHQAAGSTPALPVGLETRYPGEFGSQPVTVPAKRNSLSGLGKYGMIAAAGAGTVLLGSLIGSTISNNNGDTSTQ